MSWDLRHRKSSLVIRLLLAVWIAVIVVVLCATGRWWGLIFVVPLAAPSWLSRGTMVFYLVSSGVLADEVYYLTQRVGA